MDPKYDPTNLALDLDAYDYVNGIKKNQMMKKS